MCVCVCDFVILIVINFPSKLSKDRNEIGTERCGKPRSEPVAGVPGHLIISTVGSARKKSKEEEHARAEKITTVGRKDEKKNLLDGWNGEKVGRKTLLLL